MRIATKTPAINNTIKPIAPVNKPLRPEPLLAAGVAAAWISGRASGATTVRATELRVPHVIQGRTDKLMALQELASQLGLAAAQVCYMGDDDIDAPAIAWAGAGVAPLGSMPTALKASDYVPARPAGRGAVREVCEHILANRGQ